MSSRERIVVSFGMFVMFGCGADASEQELSSDTSLARPADAKTDTKKVNDGVCYTGKDGISFPGDVRVDWWEVRWVWDLALVRYCKAPASYAANVDTRCIFEPKVTGAVGALSAVPESGFEYRQQFHLWTADYFDKDGMVVGTATLAENEPEPTDSLYWLCMNKCTAETQSSVLTSPVIATSGDVDLVQGCQAVQLELQKQKKDCTFAPTYSHKVTSVAVPWSIKGKRQQATAYSEVTDEDRARYPTAVTKFEHFDVTLWTTEGGAAACEKKVSKTPAELGTLCMAEDKKEKFNMFLQLRGACLASTKAPSTNAIVR